MKNHHFKNKQKTNYKQKKQIIMSKIRNIKKQRDAEFINLFNKARKEYLEDTKGHSNVLEYISKEYGGDKDFYCRIARKAGYSCMKRGNMFFLGE